MHVSPRDACLAARIICPIPDDIGKSWHFWAIRAGVARDISQGSWPELVQGFGLSTHSTIHVRYVDWLNLDWPTRLGWLKLADEALLDIRLSRVQNAAHSCSARAAGGLSNAECVRHARGSPHRRPQLAYARGAGWPASGACAIHLPFSLRPNAKESTTAQSDGCAA
jgi:hypothetical protein